MYLLNLSDGKKLPASIERLVNAELKKITKNRYSFNWKLEAGYTIYKISTEDSLDILGLMSIQYFDREQRMHVRLLAVSAENIGENKMIERIAGNLFAFAARLALKKYGATAAISLVPKTVLAQHYMDKYGFEQAGISLFIEGAKLIDLLNKYYYDKK